MSDIDPTAHEVAGWAWKNREAVKEALGKLFSWFRPRKAAKGEKRAGVLVLGPGGVGKTTLARLLSGEYDWLVDSPWEYTESLDVETYRLEDAPEVEVVVPPGQELRRPPSWPALHGDIASGKYRGVILLASYGYHALGDVSVKEHALYPAAGTKAKFLKAYLNDRRNEELSVLRGLAPHLRAGRGKVWLLTLVTKEGLWWRDRAAVADHYRGDGAYAAEIRALLGQAGAGRFRHEPAFGSLLISNFVTGRGELLHKNTQGYDHRLHVESVRRLFETLDALRRWEG